MMSCRACFLAVQPAIMKPIHKMMAEMNLAKYLPVARAKEMGSPLRSVTLSPKGRENKRRFPPSQETLGNHYYHDRGTGAKAISSRMGRLLIFPDPGGISRKGRRIDQIWIANGFG